MFFIFISGTPVAGVYFCNFGQNGKITNKKKKENWGLRFYDFWQKKFSSFTDFIYSECTSICDVFAWCCVFL